ncbi:MAG: mandelate racemase [Cytophagaceae bacterium]|jgi:L-alanine-DL-glutamate epimerase-like enolase superfamily enzyme|nr:mandelate racemase [Cytophagaceae bacterium]
MSISIDHINIYASPIKLKEPFVISLGPLTHAENVVIEIRTQQGLTGFGECSPFLTINGESMGTSVVVAQLLAKVLKGKNVLDIEGCVAAMDKIIYGNSSIKSAFDMALYDLAAQHAELPLYAFLGGTKNKIIQTDYTISLGPLEKMVRDAQRIKDHGFQIIKVKLGGTKEDDIQRVKSIRTAIGPEITLRIDANQGWTPLDAIEILKTIAPYDIQHCEEPIPRWQFMKLPFLCAQSPIPIMADESCFDEHDAERLIELQACDSINVKLGKSGGIFKALKIIRLAEQAKRDIQIGGFLESRLAFTASAHLALCSDQILHYDFDTPMMFEEDPVQGGIQYGEKGIVEVPDGPGLGAVMDANYLKRLNKITV